jgi:uncharacterized protein with PIN domain
VLYLVRFSEAGRDAQPGRRKVLEDLLAELRNRIPEATLAHATGRVFVETAAPAEDVLGDLHGVSSFSPCVRCAASELESTVCALVGGPKRFAVRVRGSRARSIALGEAVLQRIPDAMVDLDDPEVTIGVEGDLVFDRVVPGIDHRAATVDAGEPRFLVDQMLGRLTPWLRLLGFDTIEMRDAADSALLRVARAEGRTLLTQDRALTEVRSVRVVFVRGRDVADQLASLALPVERARLFTRCTRCNAPVESVAKESVRGIVPPIAFALYHAYTRCPSCGKVYWQGGHYERILRRLGLTDG